jgi:SNF2 family DNA or RNA helicase
MVEVSDNQLDTALSEPEADDERTAVPESDTAADALNKLAQLDETIHLTFVPGNVTTGGVQENAVSPAKFFLWGAGARDSELAVLGTPGRATLFDRQRATQSQRGYELPLLDTVRALATSSSSTVSESASQGFWRLAAKLSCEWIARERVVPAIQNIHGVYVGRSRIAVNLLDDVARFDALVESMPLAARAVPFVTSSATEPQIWSTAALLQTFFDAVADALVRSVAQPKPIKTSHATSWMQQWINSLTSNDSNENAPNIDARDNAQLLTELREWSRPAIEKPTLRPRLHLRLQLPDESGTRLRPRFKLCFEMRSIDNLTVVEADAIYRGDQDALTTLTTNTPNAIGAHALEEYLLRDLSLAARVFRPIERALQHAQPDAVELTIDQTWEFLNAGSKALYQAGIETTLPVELSTAEHFRLQLRMRIGSHDATATHVGYLWEVTLAGDMLSDDELMQLLDSTAPMQLFHERWVAVNHDDLLLAKRLLHKRGGTLSMAAAIAAVLSRTIKQPGSELSITVVADGVIADKLTALQATLSTEVAIPADFVGTLRPYQVRGVSWLERLTQLGMGACLADDMGLGKTVQFIAYLLHRRATHPEQHQPILLVCPTSVIGNWQRELSKFAPTLPLLIHDGVDRAQELDAITALTPFTIVLTSYSILRRDASLLTEVQWSLAVLDEAQNIKNADSIGSRTARSLKAGMRIAMTGTPVENRLDELWAICEFLNPGLLGPLATFRREVAIPIERFGREDVAERLKRIVRPLILRRVKSDTSIIQDLPEKQEKQEFCLLTREQALLYQAALEENMLVIESAEGIERRGHVLKLITALKQICNHPAQYLKEDGPLANRSGKLERLRDMLQEVRANGERALIFTQYREMGARLVRELSREFGEVLFLHGGVPRLQRDAMVMRFQQLSQSKSGPALFVLSVKAGGTGLNLVAATHVFHYDRWWNPAVEDQATDRAYRIGQHQRVQVHKFLCTGTIEERVNALLESKRDLAASIVGQGEQWISELSNEQLRELFTLAPTAVMDEADSDSDELLMQQIATSMTAKSAAQSAIKSQHSSSGKSPDDKPPGQKASRRKSRTSS